MSVEYKLAYSTVIFENLSNDLHRITIVERRFVATE